MQGLNLPLRVAQKTQLMRWSTFLALSIAVFATPFFAYADGFKLGDARLQPSIDAEAHYVSNPTNQPSGETTSDVYFVGRPKLTLELESSLIELALSADCEYRRYLGLVDADTADLSMFAAHAGASMLVNKDGPFSLRLRDKFSRDADIGSPGMQEPLLHTYNDFGVGVDTWPGGGALRVSADYQLHYDRYDRDQEAAANPQAFDNIRHDPALTATWKFLPRTAFVAEAHGVITTYPGGAYGDPAVGTVETPSSTMLLTYVGVVGAISGHVSGLLKAGYGDSFTTPDRYRSLVAQTEFTYALGDTTKFSLGYQRVVAPAVLYRYVGIDHPYIRFNQLLFGRTTINAEANYYHMSFGTGTGVSERRVDQNITGSLGVDQQFGRWLTVSLIDRVETRNSNVSAGDGTSLDYLRNDVFLRLSLDIDELAGAASN